MKKFELFMGCFGNGITVCNKAVQEHGDYKLQNVGKSHGMLIPLDMYHLMHY